MIKRIVTDPQESDMGDGFGEFQFENSLTLNDILIYIRNNVKAWGTITIFKPNGEILRLFDYDLWQRDNFYINLSWELKFKVKEAKFSYCYMNEDITIKLER
jgi:hypothetical protein